MSQRVLAGERGEPDRDVAEHLGGAAARAARDDRAEALVGEHADEHLDARVGHPLDEEVLDRRAGRLELARRSRCAARRTAVGPDSPSRTAPACALCTTPGATPFSATGAAELRRGLRRAATDDTRRCSTSAIP